MHVPDHLIDPSIELLAGLGAATAIVVTARRARREPEPHPTALLPSTDRVAPLAAVAGLVLALQMVNVPVLPGTSGHLLGGALATALLGPRRALLAMAAVVATQALLFADGGAAALGVNLVLIAVLPVAIASTAQRVLRAGAPRTSRWWAAVGLGAAVAPVTSAGVLALLLVASGTDRTIGQIGGALVGTHTAIGGVELAITMVTVALLASAFDRRPAAGTAPIWTLGGITALGLSLVASSAPDGLTRALGDLSLAADGPGSILSGAPLAGYSVPGLSAAWSTSLAGGAGLLATAVLAAGLGTVLGAVARSTEGTDGAALAP